MCGSPTAHGHALLKTLNYDVITQNGSEVGNDMLLVSDYFYTFYTFLKKLTENLTNIVFSISVNLVNNHICKYM